MSRPHGRARSSRRFPVAHAICDRCGFRYNHPDLGWQFDWQGPRMANKRILVCQSCQDLPFEHNRTLLIPADPIPIANPRPEWFVKDDNPVSPASFDPLVAAPQTVLRGANLGNMTGGGGIDAPWVGSYQKRSDFSALMRPSSSAPSANWIAKNWSAAPGLMPAYPPSFASQNIGLRYAIGSFTAYAPTDGSFVDTQSVRLTFSGWDGSVWNTIWSGYSLGQRGEILNVGSSQITDTTPYYVHALSLMGDGVHAAAVASLSLYALTEGRLSPPTATPTAPLVSS